jgi:hypothetical protein
MTVTMEGEVGKDVSLDEFARDEREKREEGGFCTTHISLPED